MTGVGRHVTKDVETLVDEARGYIGAAPGNRRVGRDPVNQAMINHWVQAFGDDNPIYVDEEFAASTRHGGIVAPPAMLQTWIMDGVEDPEGPRGEVLRRLDEAGYTSVVATNYTHEYHRELRLGERITQQGSVEDLSDEKTTALGTGRFVTMKYDYLDEAGEVVGIGRMRLLKFKPPSATDDARGGDDSRKVQSYDPKRSEAPRPRPAVTEDNAFFWDGVKVGELRIQRCTSCGALRHPPRPMCDQCRSTDRDWIVSDGAGTIHSFVIHHYPPLPGVTTPHPIVLVELDEGTRFLSHMVAGTDPADVTVGRRVQLAFQPIDDELTLPLFAFVDGSPS